MSAEKWKTLCPHEAYKNPGEMGLPQTPLRGKLVLDWELPERLRGQDISMYLKENAAFTLRQGFVLAGKCQDQIVQLFGDTGSRALDAVVCALEGGVSEDADMSIEISEQHLKCSYDTDDLNLVSFLKASLSWICLSKRNEIKDRISVSKGYWDCDRFFLEAMLPVDWSGSCWTHTLQHGIIASLDFLIPRTPLLSTTFPIAFQLAAVSTPSRCENGWYFFGGMTALVPVEKRADGTILWHFESSEDDVLARSRLQSLKGRWYQTPNLDELVSSPALIGWSAGGAVMLASQASTDLSSAAHTHNSQLFKLAQVNIQMSLQFPEVLTIASAATIAPLDNLIKRSSPSNYGRLLQTLKHKPWIIYDVVGKRAWLVPLVSLLHRMILATPTIEGQNPPPCAPITIDGSGSLDVLTNNADHVVWQMGDNKTLLRDIVFDLVDQLYKTEPLCSRTNDLVGYQLADVINGEAKMQPHFVTLQPKPSWVSLLKGTAK